MRASWSRDVAQSAPSEPRPCPSEGLRALALPLGAPPVHLLSEACGLQARERSPPLSSFRAGGRRVGGRGRSERQDRAWLLHCISLFGHCTCRPRARLPLAPRSSLHEHSGHSRASRSSSPLPPPLLCCPLSVAARSAAPGRLPVLLFSTRASCPPPTPQPSQSCFAIAGTVSSSPSPYSLFSSFIPSVEPPSGPLNRPPTRLLLLPASLNPRTNLNLNPLPKTMTLSDLLAPSGLPRRVLLQDTRP